MPTSSSWHVFAAYTRTENHYNCNIVGMIFANRGKFTAEYSTLGKRRTEAVDTEGEG
jgi:hypothetical protein